jgi:uncharacterized membrane protein
VHDARIALRDRAARRWAELAVGFAALAWGIYFAVIAVRRHEDFESGRFDLGNMVQAVWSTAHGRVLDVTLANGDQQSRLGVHVDPILILLAPAWWIFPTPNLLLVVQALALAAGALPVLWLGRKYARDERLAVGLAVVYLLYPWVSWGALNDFHPVTLAVPLLLYAIWFLDADRLVAFAVAAVLACATGELIGLEIGMLGLWYAIARGRRRAGAIIAVAGFGWTLVALKVVVPAVSGGASVFYDRFETVGGSPEDLVATAFTDPGTIVHAVTTRADARYLVLLAAPLLGLIVLAPLLALVAAPQIALNLLADLGSATLTEYQYSSAVIPVFIAAVVVGLGRVGPRRRTLAVVALLVSNALWFAFAGPRPGSTNPKYGEPLTAAHRAALAAAVRLVPSGADVSSTNTVGAHLSARRRIESFPVRRTADWLVLDRSDVWLPAAGEQDDGPLLERSLREVAADPGWERVFARDGVLVYRHR